jgi:hypothetical protein
VGIQPRIRAPSRQQINASCSRSPILSATACAVSLARPSLAAPPTVPSSGPWTSERRPSTVKGWTQNGSWKIFSK